MFGITTNDILNGLVLAIIFLCAGYALGKIHDEISPAHKLSEDIKRIRNEKKWIIFHYITTQKIQF